jgi:hypothetical protein
VVRCLCCHDAVTSSAAVEMLSQEELWAPTYSPPPLPVTPSVIKEKNNGNIRNTPGNYENRTRDICERFIMKSCKIWLL